MGGLIGCQYTDVGMTEHSHRNNKPGLDIHGLPNEVIQLRDIMLGIQSDWDITDWLVEKALMDMELIECDLHRERLHAEQRLQRIQDIERRFPSDEHKDPYQRNLFDCFDIKQSTHFAHIADRAKEEVSEEEPSSVNLFVHAQSESNFDDPLLAISCQIMLMGVERNIAKGQPFATFEQLIDQAKQHNLSDEEMDEAVDFLLTTGQLIEIDDDCFIINDFDDED